MKKQELNMMLNSLMEERFDRSDEAALKRASEAVRQRYRDEEGDTSDLRISSMGEAEGYLAWRYPVTAMVIHEVLGRLKEILPDFRPQTVLDLGAGPAVSLMPLISRFPDIESITLMEEQKAMQEAGEAVLKMLEAHIPRELQIKRILGSFLQKELPGADLILASYALNELDEKEIRQFCGRIHAAGPRALVLIVPGTPLHFRKLLDARNILLDKGYEIVAPCTFTGPCHMEDVKDWCHFYERIQRSSLLRRLKSGELSFEDEKFSYLIMVPQPEEELEGRDDQARIIRHPMIRKGRREVTLCHRTGIMVSQFTKRKHPRIYRDLKDLGWGDLTDTSDS